jgi:hypothetical protein
MKYNNRKPFIMSDMTYTPFGVYSCTPVYEKNDDGDYKHVSDEYRLDDKEITKEEYYEFHKKIDSCIK